MTIISETVKDLFDTETIDSLDGPNPFDPNWIPRIRWGETNGVPGAFTVEKLVPFQRWERVRLVPLAMNTNGEVK